MSRKRLIAATLLLCLIATPAVYAGYTGAIAQKFSRGVGNVIYSPLEIPLQVSQEITTEDYVYAIPKGLLQGFFYAVGRFVVGAYEVLTFPIPQKQIIPNFNQA